MAFVGQRLVNEDRVLETLDSVSRIQTQGATGSLIPNDPFAVWCYDD